MADNNITIPIWTVSGTTPVLVTAGSFDLRVSPFTVAGIAGSHIGGGLWTFTGLDDTAGYKLYNTGTGLEVNFAGGANVRKFFDGDLQNYIRHNGTIAFTANQALGGFKLTGLGAATVNGDAVRFEQGVRIDGGTQTIAKQILFDTTGSVVPSVTAPFTTGLPTATGHLTSKSYVDALLGAGVGMVQSTYLTKLIPLRAIEDAYSHTTMELCFAYLSGLTDYATRGTTILVDALGLALNTIDLDDGTSAWVGDKVTILGLNRPILNRRAPNPSLTKTATINSCYINDNVGTSRTYVNWTFINCDFNQVNSDLTFNGCTFLGINRAKVVGGALNITACKGTALWYSDDITTTISGATQPVDLRAVAPANLGM